MEITTQTQPSATAGSPLRTKMQQTAELGTEFWNDSCALNELADAIENGAVGATSNPVIVLNAVKSDAKTWTPVIDQLVRDNRHATEDEIAWMLIEELGRRAAKLLEPIYNKTNGAQGFLSMQVNAKYYRDPNRMFDHGVRLAGLAPNIAIKAPATEAGIAAMEKLVAHGININATVSFSVAQAVAMAEACERALDAADRAGKAANLHPYITIMVGRVDDHMQRMLTKENITVNPGVCNWAGVAVFKRAHQIFKQRGYRTRLLAAAYRHHLHWTELIGKNVVQTIPYSWWKQFNNSDLRPQATLDNPIDATVLMQLHTKFGEFRKAYNEDGLQPADFEHYGATVHTLNQFLGGYQDLLGLVRERMVR
ncbi:MAG TPA: transaldolase family protein [Bdellovibrionales bacterium]|nr:transaldolase family protein [Bdellovibrionales bacterium]